MTEYAQINTQLFGQQSAPQQQGAQQSAPPTTAATTNGGGALKGNPPAPFTGERSKSRGFLNAFNLFKETNRHNETMKNPYSRVTSALTYMTGDLMESWKEDQLQQLQDRVAAGTADTDEQHWVTFETDFRNGFTNTNAAKESHTELTRLKQGDSLDEYIARFKQLARLGNLPVTEHGTIEQFKLGLKSGLLDAIISSDSYDPLTAWTFEKWTEEAQKQHGKWKERRSYRPDARARLYQTFGVKQNQGHKGGGRRTTTQGGDAMDVDATIINEVRPGQTHNTEKRAELMKNNQCFYCEKTGHRANICRKKIADRAKQGGGGTASRPAYSQGPVAQATPMTPTELAKYLQDNMGILDEDAKISVIESLMPQSFVQGPN